MKQLLFISIFFYLCIFQVTGSAILCAKCRREMLDLQHKDVKPLNQAELGDNLLEICKNAQDIPVVSQFAKQILVNTDKV